MDSMPRRSSSRIATKNSLATVGAAEPTAASQDLSVASGDNLMSTTVTTTPPSPGSKRKAVAAPLPSVSPSKKLKIKPETAINAVNGFKEVEEDSTNHDGEKASQVEVEEDSTSHDGEKASQVEVEEDSTSHDGEKASQVEVERDSTNHDGEKASQVEVAVDAPSEYDEENEKRFQEYLKKPWVPPVIERRNPMVSRLESLVTPENFKLLTEEQKKRLNSLLPGFDREVEAKDAGPFSNVLPSFWSDTRFRTQLSSVAERLDQGKYGQKFRDEVDTTMRRRANNEFQFAKDRATESFWGQKKEVVNLNPTLAGEAASVKLTTLAKHHVVRVGDVFLVRRSFQSCNKVIEKRATVTAIDPESGLMELSYPPAQMRQSVAGIEDKIMRGIHSPGQIERIVLEENGTGPAKPPNGNAFKSVTVLRGGSELGTLFTLRANFFFAYLPPTEGETGPSSSSAATRKKAVPHTLKVMETERATRSTRKKSPLNEDEPFPDGGDYNGKKSQSSQKENPGLLSKGKKRASPVPETNPDDQDEGKMEADDVERPPANKRRRATRKR